MSDNITGNRRGRNGHWYVTDFVNKHQATLTIMDGGEHWFHTDEQIQFMDNWIKKIA